MRVSKRVSYVLMIFTAGMLSVAWGLLVPIPIVLRIIGNVLVGGIVGALWDLYVGRRITRQDRGTYRIVFVVKPDARLSKD
jgi:hypothetical protein